MVSPFTKITVKYSADSRSDKNFTLINSALDDIGLRPTRVTANYLNNGPHGSDIVELAYYFNVRSDSIIIPVSELEREVKEITGIKSKLKFRIEGYGNKKWQ